MQEKTSQTSLIFSAKAVRRNTTANPASGAEAAIYCQVSNTLCGILQMLFSEVALMPVISKLRKSEKHKDFMKKFMFMTLPLVRTPNI